jgi:glycerol-3-phosphate acyltransferase PlsY
LAAAATPVVLAALSYPTATTLVTCVMGIAIAYRHRDNMRRMRFGTEARVGGESSAFSDSGFA